LFTADFPGLVVRNVLRGIDIVQETDDLVHLKVGAGENWHALVLWAVERGYGGIENLSLIPGTVGAAPIQNIGAYGVEIKDVLVSVEALDLHNDARICHFTNAECQFGYRDSLFKRTGKGRYCITSVTLALSKEPHVLHLGYGDVQKNIEAQGIVQPTIADVSRTVIQIRQSKLPDPAVLGNCGSFFKNPEVDRRVLDRIREAHPAAPGYDLPQGRVKIPAGWLIEQCGWKGRRVGATGCYEKQALVLVNYGGATGEAVKALAHTIIESVDERFGVRLEPEVNIL
jgi:UDP-N-acetylmuramate dehydrogenase